MNQLLVSAEIGGTKLQAALGTDQGEILAIRRGPAPVHGGATAILEWFARAIPALIAEAPGHGGEATHIGVGFGGPVESAAGKVLTSHQVEGWTGFELKPWFEKTLGLETFVFNDSNAAGWAEYCLGAGRGTRHFMYSNIGSGIGGALVIDGRLHDGQGLGASEVGHTYVPDWEAETPGAARKLELLCSGWSIERRMHARPPMAALSEGQAERITCALLGEAAQAGDPVARAEIDRIARSIALALANAVTLLHPERIALGGGVSLMGEVLLDPVRRWANEYVFGPFRDRFAIVPSELGESVVLVGALLLASQGKRGQIEG